MTLDFTRRAEVTLRLNGHDQTTVVSPRTTLLDWLREDIGLTGAKKGCNEARAAPAPCSWTGAG